MPISKTSSLLLGTVLLSAAPAECIQLRGSTTQALNAASSEESSCANRALDVMFVVDHSRSMSGNVAWRSGDTCGGGCKCAADNSCKGKDINPCDAACGEYYWESTQAHMRSFIKGIVKEFRDLEAVSGSSETTRFSWVGFNNIPNGAIPEWTLAQGSGTYEGLSGLIDGSFTEYAPDTCMQTGLEFVYDEWAPGKEGNRVENPDVIVMITDGAYFCGNKGNCIKNGVELDKRDPACAIDAASKLRDRGTTFFSVDILQWTCPFATTYAECLGVSDQGRAELMSELSGEKGCVPAEAPESKRNAARSLTRSGQVEDCKKYKPVLQFSGLLDEVKEIMEEVCVVVPPIDPIEIDLPCNPTPRCSERFVCTGTNNAGKNRCVDSWQECESLGYGEPLYDNEFCEVVPTDAPTSSPTDAPTSSPTDAPTEPKELPCNPTARCLGKYMCTGKNSFGRRKCVENRDDCENQGFGEALYDKELCDSGPLPCNPLGRCDGQFVCSATNNNGKNRCADSKIECIENGYGLAVYSNEACPTLPPTQPHIILGCNPLGYCDGRFVCEKLKPNGKHRCADTMSGCEEKNYGEPIYSDEACSTDSPTSAPTDSPTAKPTFTPTESPTEPKELPCNPTTRCSDRYMCTGRNAAGKRKCVSDRSDCESLGFGEALYDNAFCPLPCNPLGRCEGRFVCSKLNANGNNRCAKSRSDCVNWGWGTALYSDEACATTPPTEPLVIPDCNPIPDYCPGRYVCTKLKPNGKHRCADTYGGCKDNNFGEVLYGNEACPTEKPTTSPTKKPTMKPTTSPTTSPTASPTKKPTTSPTASPTKKPTTSPTASPTKKPTTSPTASPTKKPTTSPTASPTKKPTSSPTASPTKKPTSKPTASPTKKPTSKPTAAPTEAESECVKKGLDVMFVVDESSSLSGKFMYRSGDTCGGSKNCEALCNGACCNGSPSCSAQRNCQVDCTKYYSGTIKENVQSFLKGIVKNFRDLEATADGDVGTSRFGLVGFNSLDNGANEEFSLIAGGYSRIAGLIDQSYSSLAPDTCMQSGLEHVLTSWKPGKGGNRVGNADIVIMLTDGAYYCPGTGAKHDPSPVTDAASKLRNRGTKIYTIDVMQDACTLGATTSECLQSLDSSREELLTTISGEPGCRPGSSGPSACERYFPVLKFSELSLEISSLMQEVCES